MPTPIPVRLLVKCHFTAFSIGNYKSSAHVNPDEKSREILFVQCCASNPKATIALSISDAKVKMRPSDHLINLNLSFPDSDCMTAEFLMYSNNPHQTIFGTPNDQFANKHFQ